MELLMTTNDKTYIIAEKVGYADPNILAMHLRSNIVCHHPSIVQPTETEAILTQGQESKWKRSDSYYFIKKKEQRACR